MKIEKPSHILIAGANGGIASAITKQISEKYSEAIVSSVSRSKLDTELHLTVDLSSPESIHEIQSWVEQKSIVPDWIIQCCGILSDEKNDPEKSISQINHDWFLKSMQVNVLTNIHLARGIERAFNRKHHFNWASISAKVGSIEDNHLGGWYSYRASKAALNMFIKTLSIEWSRKFKNSCTVSIHPGTTPTKLSASFLKNIPESKLYQPEATAQRIIKILSNLERGDNGSFLNWDGTNLPW